MTAIALAGGTPSAVRIGAEVARGGGNAVDVAVAMTFATWVCEPGITSLGSGGFVTVWPVAGEPVVLDGFATRPASAPGDAARRVVMKYGGHTETVIGPGSVGVPGALAAVEDAWRRWGSRPWVDVVTPAMNLARQGFPLPLASHEYFAISGDVIYDHPSVRAWYERDDGSRRDRGEMITAHDLAATLEVIARDGASSFYGGALGDRIGRWLLAHGSAVGPDDLRDYEVLTPPPLRHRDGPLDIAAPPTVGAAASLELIALADDATTMDGFIRAMQVAFDNRIADLAPEATEGGLTSDTVAARIAAAGPLDDAPSTSHVSVVAADGLACSMTTSSGYGSGVVVPGTGFVLNNMLGELELLPHGYEIFPPRARLPSNMAPIVAAGQGGRRLALGAAGSSRIVSALARVYLARTRQGLSLEDAIDAARCHLERRDGVATLACEPGVETDGITMPRRVFDDRHMYFGGVQVAERDDDGRLDAAGDPRRDGAAEVV